MDMETSSHHAENTRYLGLIEILRSNVGYKSRQRSDQFLMLRSSVILKFILDSRFKSQYQCLGFHIQRPKSIRRYRDPEIIQEKVDHECMEDTDQEQPTIQLETSNDCIPIHERKWKDIIANEYSYRCKWESQISKVVSRLVRHEWRDRETDGAIPWKLMEALDQIHLEGKQQNQIPVLSERSRKIIVHPSRSRSLRRRND